MQPEMPSPHSFSRNKAEVKKNPLNLWFTHLIKEIKIASFPAQLSFVKTRRAATVFINFMRIQTALMIFQN